LAKYEPGLQSTLGPPTQFLNTKSGPWRRSRGLSDTHLVRRSARSGLVRATYYPPSESRLAIRSGCSASKSIRAHAPRSGADPESRESLDGGTIHRALKGRHQPRPLPWPAERERDFARAADTGSQAWPSVRSIATGRPRSSSCSCEVGTAGTTSASYRGGLPSKEPLIYIGYMSKGFAESDMAERLSLLPEATRCVSCRARQEQT